MQPPFSEGGPPPQPGADAPDAAPGGLLDELQRLADEAGAARAHLEEIGRSLGALRDRLLPEQPPASPHAPTETSAGNTPPAEHNHP
jgi:hypothetical protein